MISLWVLKMCIDNFHVGYMSLSRVLGIITNGLLCAMDILLLASLNYVVCSKCLKLEKSLVDNWKCNSDKIEINGNSWENLSFEPEYVEMVF